MRTRSIPLVLCAFMFAALAILAPGTGWAQEGREPDEVKHAGALEAGKGAVIISIRSELFLLDELSVWFLRVSDGGVGSKDNPADLVRFTRSQPALAFGNRTTKHKVRAYQLPAGRWRLAGHGVRCETVPAPDERCLLDVKVLGIGETVSFPSRGYGEGAPVFEVRAGAVTDAGDWGLTARNTVEWSPIPPEESRKVLRRLSSLPAGPEVEVPESYRLKHGLFPRSYDDDKNRRY